MDTHNFQNEIVPFYFGASPKMLYGCHHMPQRLPAKECVVVLCNPVGQEYIRSHRTFKVLALRLSQASFHVLRFDYFGCGDSDGDFEQGALLQWTTDIHTAIDEVQNRSGRTSVCLIGLRIGATLALKAAEDCRHVKSILLWEPIFDGKLYLKEIDERQRKFSLEQLRVRSGWPSTRSPRAQEVLGYHMSPDFRQGLEMINMENLKLRSDVKALIVCNGKKSNPVKRLNPFLKEHPNADFQMIQDHEVWKEESRFALIASSILGYLVNWVGRVHS